MKPNAYKFLAAFALTAVGLTLTGCQQPVAATAPAPATTVVEEVHHDGHDGDARKMQDRDHPRPDDNARRDHPEGEPQH